MRSQQVQAALGRIAGHEHFAGAAAGHRCAILGEVEIGLGLRFVVAGEATLAEQRADVVAVVDLLRLRLFSGRGGCSAKGQAGKNGCPRDEHRTMKKRNQKTVLND